MTKEEVYSRYCEWIGDAEEISEEELFANPIRDVDVHEDANTVVNHLYFLAVKVRNCKLEVFVFCEVNTFSKQENGELELIDSSFFVS